MPKPSNTPDRGNDELLVGILILSSLFLVSFCSYMDDLKRSHNQALFQASEIKCIFEAGHCH